MLELKGIGPKKVQSLWKELAITSIEELLDACKTHRVASLKGFGAKTEEAISKAIEAQNSYQGYWLFADLEPLAARILETISKATAWENLEFTGAFRRKVEVLDKVELIGSLSTDVDFYHLNWGDLLKWNESISGPFTLRGFWSSESIPVTLHLCSSIDFVKRQVELTGSAAHIYHKLPSGNSLRDSLLQGHFASEKALYKDNGLSYVDPEMRENYREWIPALRGGIESIIQFEQLKGILHNHSTYSDGRHSVAEMAQRCKDMGYSYFGIADHSKSAFYAGGLQEHEVIKQWQEIERVQDEMPDFKIFKGIESDILADGSLDYGDDILRGFDYIVASVHSVLRMDMQKATNRLIKAIENPFTTILGHPTGRILLRREGYPLDWEKILDACKANQVVVELNADPWRLDIDWRLLGQAIDKEIMISINPDAHEMDGLSNMRFGYYCARKACLPTSLTFNALSSLEIEKVFKSKK